MYSHRQSTPSNVSWRKSRNLRVLVLGAVPILRAAYHDRATSATVATTVQMGTLYVIAFATPSDVATQVALVMSASVADHFV